MEVDKNNLVDDICAYVLDKKGNVAHTVRHFDRVGLHVYEVYEHHVTLPSDEDPDEIFSFEHPTWEKLEAELKTRLEGPALYVTYIAFESSEADYEEGVDPDTRQFVRSEKEVGLFKSLDDMIESRDDLPNDREAYIAFEDGRIHADMLVDEYGAEATEGEIESWKEGERVLYHMDINIYADFVSQPRNPKIADIAETLDIERYGEQ